MVPRSPTPRTNVPPPRAIEDDDRSFFGEIDADQDGEFLEEGEGELFGFIPRSVQPTRLPGTRERIPFVMVAAALALLLLNVGAAVVLVMRLI